MAKSIAKPLSVSSRQKKAPVAAIVKVSETILEKLKALDLDARLQSDITWCLGSYGYDNNPVGLFEAAEKALVIFKGEHARKTKGVTAKLIADIEKALTTK